MNLAFEVKHVPVLLDEVLRFVCKDSYRVFVDATLGGGGHAYHILERFRTLKLIGLEIDEESLRIAKERLKAFDDRTYLFHQNFKHIDKVLEGLGLKKIDGCLFDLGLSSIQLESKRGFSFNDEGLIDMRMDKRLKKTAFDVINHYSYDELLRVIKEFGEEKEAQDIVKAIIEERKRAPIESAKRLSEIIKKVKRKRGKIHPATKTFQAIRIEVNDEISNLKEALKKVEPFLEKGGRIGVISFHSLEDRIVKEFFKNSTSLIPVTKVPIRPTKEELKRNRRARSAKLRVGEKI